MRMKKTKIIATVGPSTDKPGLFGAMIAKGMNVARFNFSHGSHEEHAVRIKLVREAARIASRPIALMADTKGPEMRLGLFPRGEVALTAGQTFVLTTQLVDGDQYQASVNYKGLAADVTPGMRILLSDGLIGLKIDRVEGDRITTTVQNSGVISSRKRVAVPDAALNLPFLSENDIADLLFAVSKNMDFVAASFVQRAADVLAIRKVLEEAGSDMGIVAKIENAEGVHNIDEIIKVVDGVMVARGDLGVEIPTEEVPIVQKDIIQRCNLAGKPVITATQMLESMISNPRPTRAEASDVANAIFDGTDVIMLSGETASGAYPVEAVEMMAAIAERAEAALRYKEILAAKGATVQETTTDAISHATAQIALDLGAAAIVVATETGYTARMVSKYRPKASIAAVTPNEQAARRMQLLWGVTALVGPRSKDTDSMVQSSMQSAKAAGIVQEGDLVVLTAGVPIGTVGTTNMIRVHVVGRVLMRGTGIGAKAVTGRVCVVRHLDEFERLFKPGDVLVMESLDESVAKFAVHAAAIVTEEGGLTSHAAILGVSFGLPVVVGVEDATLQLQADSIVTVDAQRGLIYQGEINAK